MKNEVDNTYLQDSESKFIDVLIEGLKKGSFEDNYGVDVRKPHGFSDMETAIGKYKITVIDVSE